MQLTRTILAGAAVAAISGISATAGAYPQFQLSSGTQRCNLCHFSPAGGGLLRDFGRSESATSLSRGGDGRFLYGKWEPPDWLELGADLRGVTGLKDTGSAEPEFLLFPMQGDIYARFAFSKSISLAVTGGARGSTRGEVSPTSRFGSREHYLSWQPRTSGPYVRLGKFYAPFGLREVDHTQYLRRYLGFYAWEETYNLSGGVIRNDWELHVTASAPDPLIHGTDEPFGGAALYERAFAAGAARWGLQAKLELAELRTRSIAGATAKYYLAGAKLLALAEIDGAHESFDVDGADARNQLLGHLNLTYFATRGVQVGATVEEYDEDLAIGDTERMSASLMLQVFPRAHWEAMLMGRGERISGQDSLLGFLMLHYYL